MTELCAEFVLGIIAPDYSGRYRGQVPTTPEILDTKRECSIECLVLLFVSAHVLTEVVFIIVATVIALQQKREDDKTFDINRQLVDAVVREERLDRSHVRGLSRRPHTVSKRRAMNFCTFAQAYIYHNTATIGDVRSAAQFMYVCDLGGGSFADSVGIVLFT